jgi:hypothetical protein
MVPAQATGSAFQALAGHEGDADYQLSDEITREMQSLSPAADTNGSDADFSMAALASSMLSCFPPMEQ